MTVRMHTTFVFEPHALDAVRASVERRGFALVAELVPQEFVTEVRDELAGVLEARSDAVRPHGVRNLASLVPGVRRLAAHPQVSALLTAILGRPGRLVRSILFDKVPGANWKVAWHQDLTIAVEARRDVDGFGPWSTKQGVTCVRPPAAILERLITIRFHLDECGMDNGPVRVIPGSHLRGRLTAGEIDELVASHDPTVCTADPRWRFGHASAPTSRVLAGYVARTS